MMNDRDAVRQNTAPTRNIAAVPATDRPFINQGPLHKCRVLTCARLLPLVMQPQAQVVQLDDACHRLYTPSVAR